MSLSLAWLAREQVEFLRASSKVYFQPNVFVRVKVRGPVNLGIHRGIPALSAMGRQKSEISYKTFKPRASVAGSLRFQCFVGYFRILPPHSAERWDSSVNFKIQLSSNFFSDTSIPPISPNRKIFRRLA